MAGDALTGGNGARQTVLDGVAFFVLGNGGIGGGAVAQVSGGGVLRGVRGVAVIGIDHVAGGASRRAIVARLIVGAEEIQQRIQQARALQALEYGIGPRECAESAIAEAVVTAFKDAQRIAGLGGFELRQREQFRELRLVIV